MKKTIELNKEYYLDMESLCPINLKTMEFVDDGVKCKYLSSWKDRIEIVAYEIFELNGYSKPYSL